MAPKDIFILIPRIYEYVPLYDRDFAVKDLEMGIFLTCLGEPNVITMFFLRETQEESESPLENGGRDHKPRNKGKP